MSTFTDESVSLTASVESGGDALPLTPAEAAMPTLRDFTVELAARLGTALLLGLFAYLAIKNWRADPTRITLLLLVVAEFFTLGLSLVVRVPQRRDWNPVAFLCALGATYYFLAVHLGPGLRLVPEAVGASLQIAGIGWQLFAKVSLRRSFGILPANRGVVSRGAYRFVRHPMYLGYFLMDMGFLLANFGLQNVLVYAGQFALQVVRIGREEKLLSEDERYRAYQGKVRYRVIPGLY